MNKKEAKKVEVGQAVIEKKSNEAFYIEEIRPKANEDFEFVCSHIRTGSKSTFVHADLKLADLPVKPVTVTAVAVKEEKAEVKTEKPKAAKVKETKPSEKIKESVFDSVFSEESMKEVKFKNTSNLLGNDKHAIFQRSSKEFEIKVLGEKNGYLITARNLNEAKKVWNRFYDHK